MVQILQRTRPTFGEQVAGGLQRGAEMGSQLAAHKYEMEQDQKAKNKAIVDKLEMLNKPEFAEFFKGVDPRLAKLSMLSAAGVIEPGVATSMAELIRQNQSDIEFNKALGLPSEGMEGIQTTGGIRGETPISEIENLSSPTNIPSNIQPSKKSGKDYEGQINKLQNALRYASTPQKRAQVESSIKELQRQQDAEIKRQQHEEQLNLNKQKTAFKRNEKYINRLEESAQGVRKMDLALGQMGAALDSGKFEDYRNIAGDLLGFEFLKNAPAQVVNSSIKEFLMAGLSEITGRPNQFLEQSLTKAAINPQYSNVANRGIYEGLKLLNDLRKNEIKIASELEDYYVTNEGETPRNFHKLVQEEVDKFAEPALQSYNEYIKNLLKEGNNSSELSPDEVIMIDLQGKKRAVSKKDQEAALQAGYRLKQ
jgi:hypothetical protein